MRTCRSRFGGRAWQMCRRITSMLGRLAAPRTSWIPAKYCRRPIWRRSYQPGRPSTPDYGRRPGPPGGIQDSTFAIGLIAAFLHPLDGATGVDLAPASSWTTCEVGAPACCLYVGTSPGANDVLDSGEVAGTSYLPSGLSSSGILRAHLDEGKQHVETLGYRVHA